MTENIPLFHEPQILQPTASLLTPASDDLKDLSITRRPQPLPDLPETSALRKVAARLEKNPRTNLSEDARKAAAALQVEPERAALLVTAQPVSLWFPAVPRSIWCSCGAGQRQWRTGIAGRRHGLRRSHLRKA
ncbi:hypothetical protein ACFC01_28700 [Streptomyces mirabilis]|uniref:hypothetical protein n=1 Tax=Streptomyces mirabilis TaxID=68239 RepID=UPI0035E00B21